MELQRAKNLDIKELARLNLDLMLAEKYDQIRPIDELILRMENFLKTYYDAYFVIEDNIKAGYIFVEHNSELINIGQFYIKPEYQRKELSLIL